MVYDAAPADDPPGRSCRYVIKQARPEHQTDPVALDALRREALVGGAVTHPHLVPVLASQTERSPRYVVMPRLEGRSIGKLLEVGWRPTVLEALWVARQAAEALGALHTAGWLHGDVKPANLLRSAEGHITLLDLGFACRLDRTAQGDHPAVPGTARYLAPEWQVRSEPIRPQRDLYSLGVVLFELLAGEPPFLADDATGLARAHREVVPDDLRTVREDIPPSAAELVRQLLAKQPLRRPATAEEVIGRLVRLEIAHFDLRWPGDGPPAPTAERPSGSVAGHTGAAAR